jgi:uncharacterized protein (DUF1778 family)
MSAKTHVSDRFNFRIDPDKKKLVERAAAVRGQSLTDFAVLTLVQEAREVLQGEQILVLSDRDRDVFLAALDNPPKPTAKALRAAEQYRNARARGELR